MTEAESLRAALETMAPVHIGQMYAATDQGDVRYRVDDCLYRGEVLALVAALAPPAEGLDPLTASVEDLARFHRLPPYDKPATPPADTALDEN